MVGVTIAITTTIMAGGTGIAITITTIIGVIATGTDGTLGSRSLHPLRCDGRDPAVVSYDSAAKPRARSAMMSAGSSRPMCSLTKAPPFQPAMFG
jgi:hypothetical protein